jgi:hypothetical protein
LRLGQPEQVEHGRYHVDQFNHLADLSAVVGRARLDDHEGRAGRLVPQGELVPMILVAKVVAMVRPQQDGGVVELAILLQGVQQLPDQRVRIGNRREIGLKRLLPEARVQDLLMEISDHVPHEGGNIRKVAVQGERQLDILQRIEIEISLRHYPVAVRLGDAHKHCERIGSDVQQIDGVGDIDLIAMLLALGQCAAVEREAKLPAGKPVFGGAESAVGDDGFHFGGQPRRMEDLSDDARVEAGILEDCRQGGVRIHLLMPGCRIGVNVGEARIEAGQRRGAGGVAQRNLREAVLEGRAHCHEAVEIGSK